MTYAEAQSLLAMARECQPIPEPVVLEALFMTGDGPLVRNEPCREIEAFLDALRKAGLL